MSLHYVTQQRPVTDALRRSVVEDLPELTEIGNADLRRKAVEAWAFALSHSSFGRISDIPPGGNPGMNVLKRGSQADHLRGVARLALQIADTFIAQRPEVRIDRDVVLAGALCHDVGKCYEFDPENLARSAEDPPPPGSRRCATPCSAPMSAWRSDCPRRSRTSPARIPWRASISASRRNA